MAGGGVARLERRRQPSLRPEAGALGERGAGDKADRAAALGGAQRRPEARPRRRRPRRRRTRPLRLSPRLSAADRSMASQPSRPPPPRARAFAVGDRRLGLLGAALGCLDPDSRAASAWVSISARRLFGGGDRPLLGLALKLQLLLVSRSQLLTGLRCAEPRLLELGLQERGSRRSPAARPLRLPPSLLSAGARPPRPARQGSRHSLRSSPRSSSSPGSIYYRAGENVTIGLDYPFGHSRGGERCGAAGPDDAGVGSLQMRAGGSTPGGGVERGAEAALDPASSVGSDADRGREHRHVAGQGLDAGEAEALVLGGDRGRRWQR